ncbi:MAG TPA: UbiA family prenyltransferase [Anaerolineales bacterium]|nr:UbiA family prenyltransferase [Anaerolineales bacterium]
MPLLRYSRPLHLLFAALTYSLGAGIADYLGKPFQADTFWLGMFSILLAQLAMGLLHEVFRLDVEPLLENETRRQRQTLRNNALYISLTSLAVIGITAYVLFSSGKMPPVALNFLLLSLVLIIVYALPPFRNRGFGEFLLSIQMVYIYPSIAYILQAGHTHRFLFITLPLMLLTFAYFMVMDFPTYASDRKNNRVTLLTRLGWERVIPMHHFVIALAYFFLAAAVPFGISISLIAPAFLTLPFAIFQIIQLRAIALGNPPNWKLLTSTALAVCGLTVYFLTLSFWLR